MLRFDALRTPPGDGDILIEPPARHWESLLEDNIRRCGHPALQLAGMPLEDARRAVREGILKLDREARVIAAGHQPEFVHPGVWAKHVLVRHVATRLGLAGIDFVVDNDAPRSFGLRIPEIGHDGLLTTRDIAFGQTTGGVACEGQPALDARAIGAVRAELAEALGDRLGQSMMPTYLDALAARTGASDAVEQHLAGRAAIDEDLGAQLHEIRVSAVVGGPFVADLLLDADRFRAAYNASLAEYRREHHVRGVDRPLPDLGSETGCIETALWIYRPRERRRRLWVQRHRDRLDVYADHVHVGTLARGGLQRSTDEALAGLRPHVVRPRALTLTLWARLLVCDLFVHGIGGAKYDRITDGIFRRYYQIEPPAYACVSATLRLPLPRLPSTVADRLEADRRVRDWRYNPDRYTPDATSDLLTERARLIRESDRLREARGPRVARRGLFVGIQKANARLVQACPGVGQRLEDELKRVRREVESNRIADGREYFYALQPRDRLVDLASRLSGAAG